MGLFGRTAFRLLPHGRPVLERWLHSSVSGLFQKEGIASYEDLYKYSLRENDQFWRTLAVDRLEWISPFSVVNESDLALGKLCWFADGKLNTAVNCVDRHAASVPDRVALIWEKDEPGQQELVTYKELQRIVCRMSNVLKTHGVGRGDRVAIYMPMTPLLPAAMLACARIGAVHSVVFAGFSAEALAARIKDASAETVITANEAVRGGKTIPLKQIVNDALKLVDSSRESRQLVKRVFVQQRTENPFQPDRRDVVLEEEMSQQADTCEPAVMNSEDPLFLLYTSGSTGKPKGLVHTQAGYLLYASLTHQLVFNYNVGDIFGCVADIGWVTGHSYVVYGPLCNGATSVLFESSPLYPDPGRYWEMVQRLGLNQLYLAPTALRLLLKYEDSYVLKYDRSSLRMLGCVGEPLNHEAWQWYHDLVGGGRCPVTDTWWQTETGGICIAPTPTDQLADIRPGMPMRPFFGIEPAIVDDKGRELTESKVQGTLCMKRPWPGQARGIWRDEKRFFQTYYQPFSGMYFTGDGAQRHQANIYQITGRVDDVINVSGHRIGTAELEDVLI